MRIALVHELLTMKGGAERVLKIFARMFPDAPIYTLLYDEKALGDWFPAARIRKSILQPWVRLTTNHHLFLRRFPRAVEAWDFSDFDLVISSSSAFTHGIITNGAPRHISYIHSPARYLWDRTHDVRHRAGRGLLGPLMRYHLSRTFHPLRIWDAEAAARPDLLLAASKEVGRRISLYWNRESTLLYPPIGDEWFDTPAGSSEAPVTGRSKDYFLIVSSLVPYKRIDLAIEACTRAKLPLVIAGDGPDRRRLEHMAGPTVTFLGFQSTASLRTLYASARAVLFPGLEDFGLVPLEAFSCGTPVIAFHGGGALETVTEGMTGTFFHEQTTDALVNTLVQFDHKKYSGEICRKESKNFRESTFEQNLLSIVASVTSSAR